MAKETSARSKEPAVSFTCISAMDMVVMAVEMPTAFSASAIRLAASTRTLLSGSS